MKKSIEKMHRAIEIVQRAIKKELTDNDKIAIGVMVFSLITVIVLLATIKYWGIPVLAITFLGYLAYDQRPKAPPAPVFNLVESAYQELFKVISQIHNRIGTVRPLDVLDIVKTPSLAIRNGMEIVKVKVSKTKRGHWEPNDLQMIKKILQTRINEQLRAGNVENIPFASLDNQIPIFWIDRIVDDAATLYIDLIIVDNNDKLRFVINSQFEEAAPPPPEPTDEDF